MAFNEDTEISGNLPIVRVSEDDDDEYDDIKEVEKVSVLCLFVLIISLHQFVLILAPFVSNLFSKSLLTDCFFD